MYQQIKQLLEEGEKLAVTTIVSTLGSTPREVGAKMVVTVSGEILGTIGGGCGEAEVRRRAVESIRSHKPEMVKVELLDDIESNSPAVCGGVLDAFIDIWSRNDGSTDDISMQLAEELEEISRTGNAAVLAFILAADDPHGLADVRRQVSDP